MVKEKLYTLNHQINYYECDPSGHISLSTLVALMILASEQQNVELGIDEHATMKLGGGWVIIDYEAEFSQEWPKENDQIQVQTNILAYNRFFVVRQFTVKDAGGNQIGSVQGLFVYMDLTKRKMARIPDEIMAPYEMEMKLRLPKVARPDNVMVDDKWRANEYRVRYFDIDHNGHVNNAHYFDWMLDTLDPEFLKNHRITNLRMNYEHEVRPKTVVQSKSVGPQANEQGQLVTQHKIMVGDNECAAATITWQ